MVNGSGPTETFFADYLRRKADIEALIIFTDGSGHYVTVTGIDVDFLGTGSLYYIDPLDGLPHSCIIHVDGPSSLVHVLSYTDPLTNLKKTGDVEGAVAEVPAPGSVIGLAGLAVARRRRRA
jgi:hypothetical protein